MYDVCIVGAGPAGVTLARLIGRRYRVLLVDRRRLDVPAEELGATSARTSKLCGGLLAPKAQRELAAQGLGIPGAIVVGPQLFAVRAADLASGAERMYQRFYVNIDRDGFDRWLVSLLPAQVDTAFGSEVTTLEIGRDDSLVRLKTEGGGEGSAVARLVVGADGATSLVRRAAYGERAPLRRYVAIQAQFRGRVASPHYGAIFAPALTDFYGWTIPKGDVTLAGIALRTGENARAVFDEFAAAARSAGFLEGEELSRLSAPVVRPRSTRELVCGERGVALLGEAAGFVSPSSAEGISYALRSARLLAAALEPGLERAVERYSASCLHLRLDIGMRLAKASAIYSEPARRALMASGLGTMSVAPSHTTRSVSWADGLGI